MISKPLFKQSCKANAGIWAFVTGITCAMLAIIIFVLGNLNVDKIRKSMKDMFVRDVIEANIEDQSVTYYNLASTALTNYDSSYIQLKNLLTVQLDDVNKNTIIATYEVLTKDNGKSDEEARAKIGRASCRERV